MEKRLSCWMGGIIAWWFAHMQQVERHNMLLLQRMRHKYFGKANTSLEYLPPPVCSLLFLITCTILQNRSPTLLSFSPIHGITVFRTTFTVRKWFNLKERPLLEIRIRGARAQDTNGNTNGEGILNSTTTTSIAAQTNSTTVHAPSSATCASSPIGFN